MCLCGTDPYTFLSRHGEGVNLVVVGDVYASARRDGCVETSRAGHQLARGATFENKYASVPIKSVEPFVILGANAPDHNIVRAIGRSDEGRAFAIFRRRPNAGDCRRVAADSSQDPNQTTRGSDAHAHVQRHADRQSRAPIRPEPGQNQEVVSRSKFQVPS